MAHSQRQEPHEWEWREVEYERRRRRAKEVARRRGRLRLAALLAGTAVMIVSVVLAARVIALPSPSARSSLAVVGGASIPVCSATDQNPKTGGLKPDGTPDLIHGSPPGNAWAGLWIHAHPVFVDMK